MFLEITSHIVRFSLHRTLSLLNAKVTKPQRFLGVLCSTCYIFFRALENSVLDSGGFASVTLWSSEVKQTTSNSTDAQLRVKSWFPEHLQSSLLIGLIMSHSVSYFSISTHVLHDPDAQSELKIAELVNAGMPPYSPQSCFFLRWCFSFPLWMFFPIPLLCSTVVPQKPCIVI